MAEALARGFVSKGVTSADKMFCTDPADARKQVFKEFGVTPFDSSKEVVEKGRIIFIAVKPQYVKTVLEEVRPQLTPEHVIVSIAAGVPLQVLKVGGRTRLCCCPCMRPGGLQFCTASRGDPCNASCAMACILSGLRRCTCTASQWGVLSCS